MKGSNKIRNISPLKDGRKGNLKSSCGGNLLELPAIKNTTTSKLPSLAEDALLLSKPSFQSFNSSFSSKEFSYSVPVFRRTRYDLFGMGDVSFDRNYLRNYGGDDIQTTDANNLEESSVEVIQDEAGKDLKLNALDSSNLRTSFSFKEKREKKENTNSNAYIVKSSTHQSHMKSHDERKKKLDHAIKKKQIKKDGGFSEDDANANANLSSHHTSTSTHSNQSRFRDSIGTPPIKRNAEVMSNTISQENVL